MTRHSSPDERKKKIEAIFDLIKSGHGVCETLSIIGISPVTFYNWIRKDKEMEEQYNKIRDNVWQTQTEVAKDVIIEALTAKDQSGKPTATALKAALALLYSRGVLVRTTTTTINGKVQIAAKGLAELARGLESVIKHRLKQEPQQNMIDINDSVKISGQDIDNNE